MNSSDKEEGESLQDSCFDEVDALYSVCADFTKRPVAALTARISAIATPEDSDVIRKDFEDSSSHGDQSRPRALAISHREKPKLHLKRDQACALQVANSNLSDDPTGPSSGFDSLTESDERLSINPERVKIKTSVELTVNTAEKEIPETGCIAQFWSHNHLKRVHAKRGINRYVAKVGFPAWPYREMVNVKLFVEERCTRVIRIGSICIFEDPPPRLFVIGNQVKSAEVMEAVFFPSSGDGAPSNPFSGRAILMCRSDNEAMIHGQFAIGIRTCLRLISILPAAYSRMIFNRFPQHELPRPELSLPELQARLNGLVHVVHNTEHGAKDASGQTEGVSRNVDVDAADPLYDTVSEVQAEIGNTKESSYESPVIDVVPRGNGLELRPQLRMSSETGLKILSKVVTGEISVDRAIEDANDYDTFKRLLQSEKLNDGQSSSLKPWRDIRRRREKEIAETTQSLSSTEKTDTDSLPGRRQPKSWHGARRKDESDVSSDAGSLTSSDWNSHSLPKSYGRDRKKAATLPATLNGKSESCCSKDSGLGDSLGELPIRSAAGRSNRKNAPLPEIPQSEKSDKSC
ncbi:uncharacterized protein [Oscarella lobularis]|uniref:uncharacterized protein isoform X2 n=1 Tax=Oscarella lobularis TaxID=121494 RepID=UPI003313BBB4